MMGGRVPDKNIVALAKEFSRDQVIFDALQLARDNKQDELAANALLVGAIAGDWCAADPRGKLYRSDQKDGHRARPEHPMLRHWPRLYFVGGATAAMPTSTQRAPSKSAPHKPAPMPSRCSPRARRPCRRTIRLKFTALADSIVRDYDSALWPTLIEAIHQTSDYQSPTHAATFLADVATIYALEPHAPDADRGGEKPFALTEQYARVLAAYMTYEDVIRVGQMKVAQGRFERIRVGAALKPNQIYEVTDYLKPDPYELYGLLPYPIVAAYNGFKRVTLLDKALAGREMYLEMKPKTSSFGGYALVRGLLWLKPLRLGSHRYHTRAEANGTLQPPT